MANKLTVIYNGQNIIDEALIDGNAVVNYNNSNIATVTAGQTKTLKCSEKVMVTDVGVGGKTLKCSGKRMASDVTVKVVSGKLVVFANGNRTLSAGSAVSGTSYSKNYSFTGGAIRIGAGESGRLTIQGIDFSNYSSLKIKAKLFINGDADSLYHYVGYGDTKATSDTQSNKVTKGVPKTETTLTFNIQNATGQKYIYLVCAQSGGVYIDVYDIWLE